MFCLFSDVRTHSTIVIQIGDFTDPLGAPRDTGAVVRNTIVNKAGAEFAGAAGINLGYTQHASLLHNDVSNMSYVPISVGWWVNCSLPFFLFVCSCSKCFIISCERGKWFASMLECLCCLLVSTLWFQWTPFFSRAISIVSCTLPTRDILF